MCESPGGQRGVKKKKLRSDFLQVFSPWYACKWERKKFLAVK